MTIYPVIVIYNRKCSESPSCSKLLEFGYSPVIVDNSTADFGNEEYCSSKGLQYISMHGNAGLPKAYNSALELIKGIDDGNGFVIWLDDDTELNREYFCELDKSASCSSDADVFVPVVYGDKHGNNVISPTVRCTCSYFRLRSITAEELEELKSGSGDVKVCSAINSGMCVRLRAYDDNRYNEKMFLDYVDHEFMYSMLQQGKKICVMFDSKLYQDYSVLSKRTTLKQIRNRDRIFINDFRIYGNKIGNPKHITEALILKQSFYKLYVRFAPDKIQEKLYRLIKSVCK